MNTPSKTHKKPNPKKDLLLLFAAPVAMILLAIALVYLPRLFANPTYDFIYSSCGRYSYGCADRYSIDADGKITINTSNLSDDSSSSTLYYYDASANTSTRIDYANVLNYSLSASAKSPDNYQLKSENGSGSFLFWGGSSSDSSWYLADGLKKKQINLPEEYSGSVNFIGWVEK